MSHIVTIKTEVRDAAAVRAACKRMGLAEPVQGKTKLYSSRVSGLAVQLPDWRYPVVADLQTGQLKYDNYRGRWGAQEHLDKFLQSYAVEKVKVEARKKGLTVAEQQLADGSIKLSTAQAGDRTKTIESLVSPKGETTVTTKGFRGAACREASKFIEQALGQRTEERLTAEFHQAEQASEVAHHHA